MRPVNPVPRAAALEGAAQAGNAPLSFVGDESYFRAVSTKPPPTPGSAVPAVWAFAIRIGPGKDVLTATASRGRILPACMKAERSLGSMRKGVTE